MNPRQVLAVEISLNVITVLMPVARFWILRNKKRSPAEKISDILFVLAVAISFTNVCGVCYKLGLEIELLKKYRPVSVELMMLAPKFLKMTYLFGAAYVFELFLLKGAFIGFYWGLFVGMDKSRRFVLYGASVFVFLSFLSLILLYTLWAQPIELNWSNDLFEVLDKAALASFLVNTYGSWINIGTDLIVMGLPLLVISTLRLRRPEKLALLFIFTMGGMSIAASVTRYAILYRYIREPPLTNEALHTLEMWGTVEMATAVFAFCLPSFRVMYIKVLRWPSQFQFTPGSSFAGAGGRGRSGGRNGRSAGTGETFETTDWTVTSGQEGQELDSNGNTNIPEGDAAGGGSRKIYVNRTFNVQRETWHESPELAKPADVKKKGKHMGITIGGADPVISNNPHPHLPAQAYTHTTINASGSEELLRSPGDGYSYPAEYGYGGFNNAPYYHNNNKHNRTRSGSRRTSASDEGIEMNLSLERTRTSGSLGLHGSGGGLGGVYHVMPSM